MTRSIDIAVGGHICLDIIPQFPTSARSADIAPGKLVQVGPALRSTGGAVSNAGLALHRLGIQTALIGKIGDDEFGREIVQILNGHSPQLTEHIVMTPGQTTSYSIVISPPDADRIFLHCPGANDTFTAKDVDSEQLGALGARIFHFGYPPVMRQMYLDDGYHLARLMSKLREHGITTSLDMCSVDPSSEAANVDWRRILENVLPQVDLFLPSFDELAFMLCDEDWDQPTHDRLVQLATEMLQMGAAVVVIKLGDRGLFVRTTSSAARLGEKMGRAAPGQLDEWTDQEITLPSFCVQSVGATGAGDCAVAGFLMGLLRGWSPGDCARAAAAVGAASVEAADATSGVPHWSELEKRIAAGWRTAGS